MMTGAVLARAPRRPASWLGDGRRRRRDRLRHRRASPPRSGCAPRRQRVRHGRHQGPPLRRVDHVGPGRHRRRARARRTPPSSTCTTPWSPVPASATWRRSGPSSPRVRPAVRALIALGTEFDQTAAGELSLTREGGHLRDRSPTPAATPPAPRSSAPWWRRCAAAPDIDGHRARPGARPDARRSDGGVAGVTLHVMGEGQQDGVGAVRCRAVVLASGGLGQVFAATTNPPVSTGDGMALALRAGAVLRDLEFVQFHPTVMWLGEESAGQQPLISEAVRGEGAFLVDDAGARIMEGSPPARRPRAPRRRGQGAHAPDAGDRPAARVARRAALRRRDVGAAASRPSSPPAATTGSTRSPT